jgi:hypothetical protein
MFASLFPRPPDAVASHAVESLAVTSFAVASNATRRLGAGLMPDHRLFARAFRFSRHAPRRRLFFPG